MDRSSSLNQSVNMAKILDSCCICNTKFGTFTKGHTCKRCLRNTCNDCAKQKKLVINYPKDLLQAHRICDICYKESTALDSMRKDLCMKFGEDCNVTTSWCQLLNLTENVEILEKEFNQSQQITDDLKNSQAFINFIESMSQRNRILKENYKENYSFMEMFHYMTQNVAEGQVFGQISMVVKGFLSVHYKDIGFSNDIFDTAVFLLCFSSPIKAWKMLCRIYETTVPDYAYPQNFTKTQFKLPKHIIEWIQLILKDKQQMELNVIPKVYPFIEVDSLDYITSLCLLKTNFQTSFFLLDYILNQKQKDLALIRCICSIIAMHQETIQLFGGSNPKIQRIILEETQVESIQDKLDYNITHPVQKTQTAQQQIQEQQQTNSDNKDDIRKLVEQNNMLKLRLEELENQAMTSSKAQNIKTSIQSGENVQLKYEQLQEQLIETEKKLRAQEKANADLKEDFKQKKQQERLMFQKQFEQVQKEYEDNFHDMEEKFLNACMKIMVISAEYNRLKDRTEDVFQVQEQTRERKGTIQWQSELEFIKVSLNNKDKELERTKKAYRESELKYQKQLKRVKEEVELIQNQELQKISKKFEIEKNYYEEEIQRLKQRINDLEKVKEEHETLITEHERVTFVTQQLKSKVKDLESKNQEKEDQIDELTKKNKQTEKELQNIVNNSSAQQSQLQDNQKKIREENEQLEKSLQFEKQRFLKMTMRYTLNTLELKRNNTNNQVLQKQIQNLEIDNSEIQNKLKQKEQQAQLSESSLQSLREEMDSYKLFQSQVKQQDQSGKIEALEKQIKEVTDKYRKLFEDNSQLQMDHQNLQVLYKRSQDDLNDAKETLEKIEKEHENDKQQIKEEYEQINKTISEGFQRQIDKLKQQLEEEKKNHKKTREELEEKIAKQALLIHTHEQTIDKLEEQLALLQHELKNKLKYIEELEQKIEEQKQKIHQLEQTIQKQEEKIVALAMEIKRQQQEIENMENEISELKKQIQLKNKKIEELENNIQQLEKDIEEKNRTIEELEDYIRRLKKEIEQLQNKIGELEEKIAYYLIEMEKKNAALFRITLLSFEIMRQKGQIQALTTQLQQEKESNKGNQTKFLEACKRLVMSQMEIKRMNRIFDMLEEKNINLSEQLQFIENRIKVYLKEASDAKLAMEKMQGAKLQLENLLEDKQNNLSQTHYEFESLKALHEKTLQKYLIIACELERQDGIKRSLHEQKQLALVEIEQLKKSNQNDKQKQQSDNKQDSNTEHQELIKKYESLSISYNKVSSMQQDYEELKVAQHKLQQQLKDKKTGSEDNDAEHYKNKYDEAKKKCDDSVKDNDKLKKQYQDLVTQNFEYSSQSQFEIENLRKKYQKSQQEIEEVSAKHTQLLARYLLTACELDRRSQLLSLASVAGRRGSKLNSQDILNKIDEEEDKKKKQKQEDSLGIKQVDSD